MLLELIAAICTSLFAGAAIYINLVEHPARLETGTAAAVKQWRLSYRRATVMQASLAIAGFLSALGAWAQGRGIPVLVGGLLLESVVPFTSSSSSPQIAASAIQTWTRVRQRLPDCSQNGIASTRRAVEPHC